ncbi:hypothetical protein [Pseudoxanthomonas koreensis]|uniref:hypothetical protein n=1 Tax=Pseudoxanthomonas koreensis TaxID=266061 RepID=UPI001391C616|nr:hypothetical protein [Pseudoxanthomonas koreensis]
MTDHAAKCAECLALLSDLYAPPVTPRDVAEHREMVAREMARAEARRAPGPQMELPAP